MKKSFINSTHIEGYLYEHSLQMKTSGPKTKNPGVEFISGDILIATDSAMTNVIPVHYSYTTGFFKNGNPNPTFAFLKSIIDGKIGSVMEHGKENAAKLRIDSALDLNEFISKNNNELVSVRRNEGGFIHQVSELAPEKQRATFNVDVILTGANRVEADPNKDMPEKVNLKGYVFNFRNEVLPVELAVYAPYAPSAALDYFENLGISGKSPVFTRVQGQQVSRTIVRQTEEESAFGEILVKEIKSTQKDFVVNWAQVEPYEWDSENTILASELTEALAQRELKLAELKNRNNVVKPNNAIPSGDYDF